MKLLRLLSALLLLSAVSPLLAARQLSVSEVNYNPLDSPDYEFSELVNLGPTAVADVAAHARLIEVVSDQADEAAAGRQRWRQYLAAGLKPVNHAQGDA